MVGVNMFMEESLRNPMTGLLLVGVNVFMEESL